MKTLQKYQIFLNSSSNTASDISSIDGRRQGGGVA